MSNFLQPVALPEGQRGQWKISRFVVSKEDARFSALRAAMKGRGYVPAGTYTSLTRNGAIVMSDTPDEMRDHSFAVRQAKGHTLINGLGIGMVLAACLRKRDVERVTVVEIDPDIIALVGPHYRDRRVEIVNTCAFDYQPPKGVRYGMVWHDIWSNICGDNLPEMTRLKRKYARRADWQGCWCQAECKR